MQAVAERDGLAKDKAQLQHKCGLLESLSRQMQLQLDAEKASALIGARTAE